MSAANRLASVFQETFGFDSGRFSEATSPEDVPNWDSVGHMNLVAGLEKEFGVQFELDEIMEMSSAARILSILQTKGIAE
jgi:acyl carrier protein